MNEFSLLQDQLQGQLRFNEPLAKHCTWKVGGTADIYFIPDSREDLIDFLKKVQDRKILFIGLGSNILFSDAGYPGVVINLVGSLKGMEMVDRGSQTKVRAEAGVTCAKFSRIVTAHGLSGAEFLSGIPGSMGGALAMNAGAFGGSCWDAVEQVETIDNEGNIRLRDKAEFVIDYRSIKGLATKSGKLCEWFISACFTYKKDQQAVIEMKQKIKQLLLKRNETQPLKWANAGSVFKNPPGDYAARLIESCLLKGKRIGDAEVSHKHANFIINHGRATANDIKALILQIQETVLKQKGVKLETEVVIVE